VERNNYYITRSKDELTRPINNAPSGKHYNLAQLIMPGMACTV